MSTAAYLQTIASRPVLAGDTAIIDLLRLG